MPLPTSRSAPLGGARGLHFDPCADRRRLQSRPRAAARLVAAGAPRGAEPRLGADERGDDQGRRLRLRAHRIRPHRHARLVVEHGGAGARRDHRGHGRALRTHATRPQAAARVSHRGEHRDHFHRTWPRARLQGPRHGMGGCARAHRRSAACLQPFDLQEPAVFRRRGGADQHRGARHRAPRGPSAVPDHPTIPQPRLRCARAAVAGACNMAVIFDFGVQGAQMLLVLLLAPLLTGFTRKMKARLLLRRGPPLVQPYRDLVRLMRKEVVLAENASWLFRVIPYLIFAATWVAAALVPTFALGLTFSWSADLIAIVGLLGSARFFLALAGLDIGTSFGGIGSSREVMIASLAEPALIIVVFTLALIAGPTQLSTVAGVMQNSEVGLRVSLGLALIALVIVAIAENARIPVDNPATHLELTMVHEAMVLEYSGRHLALIELSASLKLLLYLSLIACVFAPWGLAGPSAGLGALAVGALAYLGKLATGGFLLALFETSIAKMRVFRVPEFLGAALMLGLLATLLLFVSRSL